ncbi:MAG: hypothetical protein KF874_02925 [Rhizobiaceae bacterium]|nr:hypothetical protein [Rhizobiaceae bacterium]
MEQYNFWQDFFASYRSSSDAIKALWLISPPAFIVSLAWVVLNARRRKAKSGQTFQSASHVQDYSEGA